MVGTSADRVKDRVLFIPRMCDGASRTAAAAFRAVGVDARVCPPAGPRALELAKRHTSGEECYPQVVTLAELFEAMDRPGFDPSRAAFMMPTTTGPCRFGQYAPFLRRVLDRLGYGEVALVSPNSDEGYRDVAEAARDLRRTLWWATVGADLLRRILLRTRPYESVPGRADRAYGESLEDLCRALEDPSGSTAERLDRVVQSLRRAAERFRSVPVEPADRVLVGVVGEIFCRLNVFSNHGIVRRLEALGAEAWLSGIGEWVWYVNAWEVYELRRQGRARSRAMLGARISQWVQRRDEHALEAALEGCLDDRPEPHDVGEVLDPAAPYLPWEGALGEMVMSVGKAVYLQRHGADAVMDVSPFGCMNGVVSEAVYPRVSRDHGGIPIRVFYVDETAGDLDLRLEMFLDLARAYRARREGTARAALV